MLDFNIWWYLRLKSQIEEAIEDEGSYYEGSSPYFHNLIRQLPYCLQRIKLFRLQVNTIQ